MFEREDLERGITGSESRAVFLGKELEVVSSGRNLTFRSPGKKTTGAFSTLSFAK